MPLKNGNWHAQHGQPTVCTHTKVHQEDTCNSSQPKPYLLSVYKIRTPNVNFCDNIVIIVTGIIVKYYYFY